MNLRSLSVLALGTVLVCGSSARAVDLDTYVSTALFPADTRPLGLASDSTGSDPVGTGWVNLQSFAIPEPNPEGYSGTQQKVAPFFSATVFNPAAPTSIGTLGSILTYDADWYRDNGTMAIPAFRMLIGVGTGPQGTASGFAEFIWEAGYQDAVPTFTLDTTYTDVNLNGNFYVRGNFNFDAIGTTNYGDGTTGSYNPSTIAEWTSGVQLSATAVLFPLLSPGIQVYGVQTAVGSFAGVYSGFVDDINITFAAVPEPTTLGLILSGIAGLLAVRRSRTV